jgi:hypothetical protein
MRCHAVAKVVPLSHRAGRTGRGSLRGTPVTSENWDSDAVNQAIADDFGPTGETGGIAAP